MVSFADEFEKSKTTEKENKSRAEFCKTIIQPLFILTQRKKGQQKKNPLRVILHYI